MQFDIEYLFAERCICGAARDDGTFCAACRSKHEHLLSTARAHTPNRADDPPTCPGTGLADCGKPLDAPGYCARCAEVLDRVFVEAMAEPPDERVIEMAA